MAWPNGTRLKTFANGGSFFPADANNIEDRMLQIAGYRGQALIATEESRTNTSFGTMATPDQVTGVVVAAGDIIVVSFMAMFKNSVGNAGAAALFIGANQLQKIASSLSTAPGLDDSGPVQIADTYRPLVATQIGMDVGGFAASGGAYTGDVTTGMVMFDGDSNTGAHCLIDNVAAGTYTISIQYKSTSGSVTVKNRRLRVHTLSFT